MGVEEGYGAVDAKFLLVPVVLAFMLDESHVGSASRVLRGKVADTVDGKQFVGGPVVQVL